MSRKGKICLYIWLFFDRMVRTSLGRAYNYALTKEVRTDVKVLDCENLKSRIYIFKIWLIFAVI